MKLFQLLAFLVLSVVRSQSTANLRGKRIARELWENEGYSCENIEPYRKKAERTLYRQCDDEFKLNIKFVNACNDGVNEVIEEKERPCVFEKTDCKQVGNSIGLGVAALICETVGSRSVQPTFSEQCIRAATDSCLINAKKTMRNYIDEESCGGKNRVTRKMEREARDLCKSEVENFATI